VDKLYNTSFGSLAFEVEEGVPITLDDVAEHEFAQLGRDNPQVWHLYMSSVFVECT
jgi:hypothetical protein